jgi:hypothetical protein
MTAFHRITQNKWHIRRDTFLIVVKVSYPLNVKRYPIKLPSIYLIFFIKTSKRADELLFFFSAYGAEQPH